MRTLLRETTFLLTRYFRAHELLDCGEGESGLTVAFFDLPGPADLVLDQRPCDVRRLIAVGRRFCDVAAQGSESRVVRKRMRRAVAHQRIDVARDQEANRGGLDVALNARDLAGEEHALVFPGSERIGQMPRAVDEPLAVHRAEPREGPIPQASI